MWPTSPPTTGWAAAHYILDAHNDSGNEYNWEVAKVVNAAEYYAYTAYQLALESATDGTDENGNAVKLDEDGEVIEEVAAVAAEDIGVKAVDDYTLVYTLEAPCSYFLSMLCWSAFMPVNGVSSPSAATASAPAPRRCSTAVRSTFPPLSRRCSAC